MIYLRKAKEWLVNPSPRFTKPIVAPNSRLIAGILLTLIAFGIIYLSFSTLGAYYSGTANLLISLAAIGTLFVTYYVNRIGLFKLAAWLTILLLSAAFFSMTFITDGLPVDLDFLNYLIIPLLLISIFLSESAILVLGGIFALATLILSSLILTYDPVQVFGGPVFFIVIASGMIYAISRHRNSLEDARARELIEKERLYRSLFEAANDAIFLVSLDNVHTAANQKAAELLGYTVEELIGKHVSEIVVNRDYPDSMRVRNALLTGLSIPLYERIFRKKDGTEIPVEINVSVIKDKDGNALLFQSIVRDISQRKAAEAKIQEQIARLNALREIDLSITGTTDLQEIASVVLDQVVARLEVDAADILLVDSQTKSFDLLCSRGIPPGANLSEFAILPHHLPARIVARGDSEIITDIYAAQADYPRLGWLGKHGFNTGVLVPVFAKGEIKGILEVFNRQSLTPTNEWLDFLETLGGQLAIAIDSTQIFRNLQNTNLALTNAYDATIEGWSLALDLRDKETEGHSLRVTNLTLLLADQLGFDSSDLTYIRWGSLLHDIGKMGVPDQILQKPAPLTPEEWEIMKQHPGFAYDMLKPIKYLGKAIDIPYCHHEKWDGSGYPRGLKGTDIPLSARMFAIVDVWDALTSDRPYRPAWSREKTIQHIVSQSGKHFDPQVVEIFIKLISSY